MQNISISSTISLHLTSKRKKKVNKHRSDHFVESYFLATTNEKPRQRLMATASNSVDNPTLSTFDEARSDDVRRYHCPDAKWKLQPTIKLLTAYGNEVEPFGADYILQKLGFRHARLTIPKWLQRGVMDPCEQSMTVVQLFLIFLLPERFKDICMRQGKFSS